ncbi:ParB/RepB/Spo0J family partition protein [Deinococcus sp. Arct2-2]|uniref:ParB/RepB/Spo0J family partition protein n=1 Tax=Deinococcus sp. Arct2-2 TaxID=2568653 RepID=UPI001454DFCB|nr:ParB/RepB/Spo0J family partition protein [Deinococcus sp. Arct2-2]
MSSKRGKLAERRSQVGQSSTPITVQTEHLERVPASALDEAADVVAFWIPVGDIHPSPFQYRYELDEGRLSALMASIAAQELYQPITVRPREAGTYEVVVGHRRLEAFKRLGHPAIPAIVREYSDTQAIRALLDENLKRADVNLFEQTEGVVQLLTLECQLVGEPAAAVRRLLEEMRGIKRSGLELNDARHLSAARVIQDVAGMTWESFLINRLSVYRLSPPLLTHVRAGMPYSLAVAVGRLEPRRQAEAMTFLQSGPQPWRSREEFKAWAQQLAPADAPSNPSQRFKKLAYRLEHHTLSKNEAERVSALLDELEHLLT